MCIPGDSSGGTQGCFEVMCVEPNIVGYSCKRLNGAIDCICCVVADHCTSDSLFLVSEGEVSGSSFSGIEGGASMWYDGLVVPECSVG